MAEEPKTETVQVRKVVFDVKPEVVTRTVSYCERVPYEQKIKVPVCVPAPAPAACCN